MTLAWQEASTVKYMLPNGCPLRTEWENGNLKAHRDETMAALFQNLLRCELIVLSETHRLTFKLESNTHAILSPATMSKSIPKFFGVNAWALSQHKPHLLLVQTCAPCRSSWRPWRRTFRQVHSTDTMPFSHARPSLLETYSSVIYQPGRRRGEICKS